MGAENLSPSLVPLVLVGLVVLAASGWLLVALALHREPHPADVAVAYEHAWDRLDFATLWKLSGESLRDGRSRAAFVADKQAAYRSEGRLAGLVRSVRPEVVEVTGPMARILTRLELADGQSVTDEVLLEKAGSTWRVTAYRLASPAPGKA